MKKGIRWAFVIFVTPVLLWLFLLIVLPHIDLLIMSFRIEDDFGNSTWSVSNYLNFFKEPIYWLTFTPVSYTHLTLPTNVSMCRSRWSPYH